MRIRLVRLACFSVSLVLSFSSAHADDDSERFYRGRTVSLLISSGEGGGLRYCCEAHCRSSVSSHCRPTYDSTPVYAGRVWYKGGGLFV